jgi:spoIIIJ-associated protein
MQEPIESTGRNVEEALASALAALGAKAAEVRWDVVESGSTGLRKWFGGRPARVRVERVVYKHADVRSLVDDLLAAMDIPAAVEVTKRADTVEVMITTQGLDGLLIGKRGQTLTALQHVIGRMVSKEFGFEQRVVVDVGDYRQRRETQLVDKARALAHKVKVTGREINHRAAARLRSPRRASGAGRDRRHPHLPSAGAASQYRHRAPPSRSST